MRLRLELEGVSGDVVAARERAEALGGSLSGAGASLELTLWLMTRYRISLPNVIGHAESLTSPYHRERYAPWRCQTHGDWTHADMRTYRARLAAFARSEHVAISRAGHPVRSTC